ncbi:hypothetical protein MGN70_005211 [Eutypa lata]|nr:hypothetical protein MGN70_005211 [Eutypa lata]
MPAMARPDNASGVAAGDAVVYCVGVVDIEAGVAKAGVAVEADDEVNPVGVSDFTPHAIHGRGSPGNTTCQARAADILAAARFGTRHGVL